MRWPIPRGMRRSAIRGCRQRDSEGQSEGPITLPFMADHCGPKAGAPRCGRASQPQRSRGAWRQAAISLTVPRGKGSHRPSTPGMPRVRFMPGVPVGTTQRCSASKTALQTRNIPSRTVNLPRWEQPHRKSGSPVSAATVMAGYGACSRATLRKRKVPPVKRRPGELQVGERFPRQTGIEVR